MMLMPRMLTINASAPKSLQLLRGQIAQHDADQKTDERGDAERLRAGAVDVGGNLAPRNTRVAAG